MKHNIYAVLSSFLMMIVLSACTKLDEELYSDSAIDNFGKNQTQVNALVGPIYSTLKDHNLEWDGYLTMDGLAADMIVIPGFKGGDWGEPMFKEMMKHTWTATSSGFNRAYNGPNAAIALCNQIYYQIDINKGISDTDKQSILAEIRGVRAFWYYTLCDHYGNVPIVTDFLSKEQPETKSRKEVYEFIVKELTEVKDKLRSDVATPASYGKFTKGTAYTLLAKMYLNAQIWNPDGGSKWNECLAACDSVMAMPYVLENNWKTNFIPHNEVSKEAIFSSVFRAGGSGIQNGIATNTLHYLDPIGLGLKVNTYNGMAANPAYVKSFDTTDVRYSGSFLIGPMKDPQTGLILQTSHGRPLIHTVDVVMNDVDAEGIGWINQEEGARVFKWDFEPGLATSMENDIHIFRLADVYLMKAEALIRSGGNNAIAAQLVNRLRERAFPGKADKLLGTITLDDIYKERKYELAWEGSTRQDMVRFGTFLPARPPFKLKASDAKYLLFPIPQEAINANNKLKQNPGY